MKLSQNFTLAEFTHSETAKKNINKFPCQFNPPKNIINNLIFGAENIAEKIRAEFVGFAPTVAYRSPKFNASLKNSSQTSMHVTGEAFDETFIKDGVNISAKVFFWLLKSNLPFTELIWERGDSKNPNWLHIGWRKQANKEILVFNGKSYYNYYGSAMHKEHIKLGLV
jgi:hypothetical protein